MAERQLMGRTEYARHQEVKASSVDAWKKRGLVIYDDESGLIDVAATDANVVGARSFGKGGNARKAVTAIERGEKPKRHVSEEEQTYAKQQIRRVQLQAERHEIELQRELGKLIDAQRCAQGIEAAFTAVREAWLGAADRLHTRIASEVDPRRCHQLILADAQRALDDLAVKLEDLAGNVNPV
jgi:hypothetical protein